MTTTGDLRAIRDEIGIMPSTLDLAASMRRLIDALIDEREGELTSPDDVNGFRVGDRVRAVRNALLAPLTGEVTGVVAEGGWRLRVRLDGGGTCWCNPDDLEHLGVPADRRTVVAEMTRAETAEGMRADGFPPADTPTPGLGDALRETAELRRLGAAPSPSTLDALADRVDALADERDTLRAALGQERRSMAGRLAVLERIKGERDRLQASVAAAQRWIGDHIREEREQGIDGAFIDGGCLRTLQRDMDEALSGDGGATAVEVDVAPDLGRFHERIAAVASYLGKSETALRSVYAEAIREDAAARRALAEAIDRWAQAPVTVRWSLDGPQDARGCPETGATDTGVVPGGVGAADAGEGRERAPGWRQRHANEAEKALAHPLVVDVMAEMCDNLGVSEAGLPAYGIAKVASYAAQVARAQALGIDPDELRGGQR